MADIPLKGYCKAARGRLFLYLQIPFAFRIFEMRIQLAKVNIFFKINPGKQVKVRAYSSVRRLCTQ